MAEIIIDGKKYEAELGPDGQALTPPIPKFFPQELEIDLLQTLSNLLFDDKDILNAWAKDNIFVGALLSRGMGSFSLDELDKFKILIEDDRDDENSPLTETAGNKLVALVDSLRGQLGAS